MNSVQGAYEGCIGCRAPVVFPLPSDWSVDVIKRGPRQGPVTTSLMPHRPGCIMQPIRFGPNEGTAVRVPGSAVTELSIDYDRWAD